ncbi:MAG TPA: tyrosine-type recombinase/integrase [Conexibacter sp.]
MSEAADHELAVEVGELIAAGTDLRATRRELAALLLQRASRPEPPRAPRLPGEVAEAFLRGYAAGGETRAAYARDLAQWFVWLDQHGRLPFDVTRVAVDTFTNEPLPNAAKPKPSTIARRLAAVSGFYAYALDEGLIDKNPVARVKRPRISDRSSTLGLSKARAKRLLQAARHEGPREHLLVLLLLHLGLRVSEAVNADVEDLGEEQGHAVLRIKGKGEKEKRTPVPLNPALQAAIAAVRAEGREQGPLLSTSTGARLTRQHAGKIVKRLGEQIGLPSLHPHALRHTFVTLSLNEGASLRDVQDAARHADPHTTRRYDRDRNNLARHPTHRLLGALEP